MQHLRWPLPVRPALPAPHVEKAGHGGARRPPRCSAVAVIRRAGTRGRPALDHSLVRCGVHRGLSTVPTPVTSSGARLPRRSGPRWPSSPRQVGRCWWTPTRPRPSQPRRVLLHWLGQTPEFLDYRLRRARARPRLVQHPRPTLTAAAGD